MAVAGGSQPVPLLIPKRNSLIFQDAPLPNLRTLKFLLPTSKSATSISHYLLFPDRNIGYNATYRAAFGD